MAGCNRIGGLKGPGAVAVLACGLVGAGGWASSAQGAVVAQWEFASNVSVTRLGGGIASASDLGVNFSISASLNQHASAGHAVNGSTYPGGNPINNKWEGTSGGTPLAGPAGRAYAYTFHETGTTGRAYQFNVTVEDGQELDLTNVWFDAGFRSKGPSAIRVAYSTASDFTNEVTIGQGSGWAATAQTGLGYGTGGTLGVTQSSGSNFSWNRFSNNVGIGGDEKLTGTVYFRIYAAGGQLSEEASAALWLDNLTVEGTVSPVPEPASVGLIGLGAWLMLRRPRG